MGKREKQLQITESERLIADSSTITTDPISFFVGKVRAR
jgi:hypothetical protein